MKPSILTLDTLCDRKEIWSLLHKLSPHRRVEFLDWCCEQVSGPGKMRPVPSRLRMAETIRMAYRCDKADLRLTNECYTDCLMLSSQYKLDLGRAAVELEARVKRPNHSSRPASSTSASGAARFHIPGRPGSARPA